MNNPESARRQLQIQKLLEAINNYSPSADQIEAMKNAKRQMIKNIEKKFALSKVNLSYKFPYRPAAQINSDDEDIDDIPQICNIKTQNSIREHNSKSKQKLRRPLQQKSTNKSQTNLHSIKKFNDQSKEKQKDPCLLKNIEKALKSGIKCQTPKVIEKQIVLTHKKQPSKENTKNQFNLENQGQLSQMSTNLHIKTKLKIKKPNNSLNNAKKYIHLRTQNNINFKNYDDSSNKKIGYNNFNEDLNDYQLFHQAKTEQKYVIYEEQSEESMFFNSRNNQNIDQNTNFQYPQALFNVSDLKEKLRQTSKSKQKEFIKRHKRTATEGCPEIKIKLFSNSFKKNSCEKSQTFKKLPFQISLFKKHQNTISSSNIMNRTVSSLSQHSLKKGIKLCGKMDQNGQRSLSKGSSKYEQINVKQPKKHTISKLYKEATQQISDQIDRKNFMFTHSFLMKDGFSKGLEFKIKKPESKEKNSENKSEKQNLEINKTTKINSIMTSLKEGYKVKNGGKPQNGIKTTVCR